MIELNENVKDFFYSNKEEITKEIIKRLPNYGYGSKIAKKHLKYKGIDFTRYMFMNYHNKNYVFLIYSRQYSVELMKRVLLDIYSEHIVKLYKECVDSIINSDGECNSEGLLSHFDVDVND